MRVDDELPVIASHVLDSFRIAGKRVATAESCTGGLIGAILTSLPGSSHVYERGFVTYSNDAKREAIGVPAELLDSHGAVSAPVAAAMAEGALHRSRADAAVAVTGIAGPDGGTEEKPVGLVYIAVSVREEEGAYVEEFRFGPLTREEIRNATVRMALEMLLAYGLADPED